MSMFSRHNGYGGRNRGHYENTSDVEQRRDGSDHGNSFDAQRQAREDQRRQQRQGREVIPSLSGERLKKKTRRVRFNLRPYDVGRRQQSSEHRNSAQQENQFLPYRRRREDENGWRRYLLGDERIIYSNGLLNDDTPYDVQDNEPGVSLEDLFVPKKKEGWYDPPIW